MPSIEIPNLDEELRRRLSARAAANGRSIHEEVCSILREATKTELTGDHLLSIIREHFGPLGGVELKLPPREVAREPPTFT